MPSETVSIEDLQTAARKDQLLTKLARYEQQHLLHGWDELEPAVRNQLADQIEEFDFEALARLFSGGAEQTDWETLAAKAESPLAVRMDSLFSAYEARERGN